MASSLLYGLVLFVAMLIGLGCSSETGDSLNKSEIPPLPANTLAPTPDVNATDEARLSAQPTVKPAATLTPQPTVKPAATPTPQPTVKPAATPTPQPTVKPAATPTPQPTAKPAATPTPQPTAKPAATPTPQPTLVASSEGAPTGCRELLGRGFDLDEIIVDEEAMACLRQLFAPQTTNTPMQPPTPQTSVSTGSEDAPTGCRELLGRGFVLDEVIVDEEIMACLHQLFGS